jgi:ANTAR domain
MGISNDPEEFATRAATVLGAELEVSVTVRQHGATVRAGSSTEASARCDRAESLADAGPCVEAMDRLSVRVVPAIASDDRWPVWHDQAVEEGFLSAAAVPAVVASDVAVALNLYSRRPDPWTPSLLAAADSYAQLLAASVRLRLEAADLEDAVAGFYRHMSDAVVVERAVGAIMQTNRCTQEQARQVVDSAARHRGISERDVAEAVLRTLAVPDDRPDEGQGAERD